MTPRHSLFSIQPPSIATCQTEPPVHTAMTVPIHLKALHLSQPHPHRAWLHPQSSFMRHPHQQSFSPTTPWLRFPSPCCHNPVIASISTIDTSAYHPRSWSYESSNPSPNPFLIDIDLLLVEFQNQNMKVNFLTLLKFQSLVTDSVLVP